MKNVKVTCFNNLLTSNNILFKAYCQRFACMAMLNMIWSGHLFLMEQRNIKYQTQSAKYDVENMERLVFSRISYWSGGRNIKGI